MSVTHLLTSDHSLLNRSTPTEATLAETLKERLIYRFGCADFGAIKL